MRESKAFTIYAVILILIAIAGFEAIARLKYQKSYLSVNMKMDRTFHHMLPPKATGVMNSENEFNIPYTANNRGMRGPGDYSYEKTPGVFRIAVMGDSYTFGVGVGTDETYASVLQTRLDAEEPSRHEVMNFGVSSFSPTLEFIYLKKELFRYKPDMLILAMDFCDIQDDYFYEKNLIYDKKGDITGCDPFTYKGHPNIWKRLKEGSIFFSIIDEKVVQSFNKMKTLGFIEYYKNKFSGKRNKTEILTNLRIDNIEFDRFVFVRENKNPEIVNRHWKRTAAQLAAIKKFCDEQKIEFLLVTYPYGHQVGVNQWTRGRHYWAFEDNRVYEAGEALSLIRQFTEDNGIEWIDLLPVMRQNSDKILYYDSDGHWTAAGHAVTADALFESPKFKNYSPGIRLLRPMSVAVYNLIIQGHALRGRKYVHMVLGYFAFDLRFFVNPVFGAQR